MAVNKKQPLSMEIEIQNPDPGPKPAQPCILGLEYLPWSLSFLIHKVEIPNFTGLRNNKKGTVQKKTSYDARYTVSAP